ncbi:DUF3486 family protein [Moritella viscosa]|uniref:Mu-like prophage FluMu protein gp27 n=1 Tax=Moritella viscosa TaxID=80854 RepID=A0ABY1H9Z8_9GAMM|nr:DUF3486 family protein [Moritella viscosa]CED61148.1 bacteriophage Mu-like gp27 protein [Moritella viscosa]SGY85138.1 Mu-like prophage FluMu protein gp27 [Moritella viscosa]SGY87334.1 Mu-like prophage FluMu protein gp27 [Moritella viscosa]SHN99484.1 Mu-like prophage FluMu protein gp27 [Moritella viscosa]SHO20117.1 Mu-like prophage FluMu protein gp27 [Moritella viscosa]
MSDKPHTKKRVSKIDRLPDDIRTQLNILLRDGRMPQTQIREAINTLIDEFGLSEEDKLSRNGLSRYAINFNQSMTRYRQAQEMTGQWVQQFGEMPQTDIARALIEIGKSQIFDFQMKAMESDDPIDPKTMGHLALSIKRLQEAQVGSVKLEKEIRKAFAEEAAAAVDQAAKISGLSKESVQQIKNSILGLA